MKRGVQGFLGIGAGLMMACGVPGQNENHMLDEDPLSQGIASDNGLQAVNGLTANNGLVSNNGLMTNNGLATNNGLRTNNGLATNNGLMTNNGGRLTVKYLVKCALSAGDSMQKADNTGTTHTYTGGMGFGTGWKDGSCDQKCREYISSCMLAHLNSTGNSVPIWVNADPAKAPQVGWGMAYESGSDKNIQEGVFMGDVLAMNPPKAYFAKGNGFKGNIPGRLGASTSNPYKPWYGYRVDQSTYYEGVAAPLCRQKQAPDGIHWDFEQCQRSGYGFGPVVETWNHVVTSYVNANYSGAVSQNWTAKTLSFEDQALGHKTNEPWEVWTYQGFDFSNSVNAMQAGEIDLANANGSKRLCIGHQNFIVITKNGGEPFSLTEMKVSDEWTGAGYTVKIHGYKKNANPSRLQKDVWVPAGNGATTATFSGWDNMIKIEVQGTNSNICIDDVKLKT